MQEEEDEDVLFKSIRENPNQRFGEEDRIYLPHIEEPVGELNSTN